MIVQIEVGEALSQTRSGETHLVTGAVFDAGNTAVPILRRICTGVSATAETEAFLSEDPPTCPACLAIWREP